MGPWINCTDKLNLKNPENKQYLLNSQMFQTALQLWNYLTKINENFINIFIQTVINSIVVGKIFLCDSKEMK